VAVLRCPICAARLDRAPNRAGWTCPTLDPPPARCELAGRLVFSEEQVQALGLEVERTAEEDQGIAPGQGPLPFS
jgi:hypothetical protein